MKRSRIDALIKQQENLTEVTRESIRQVQLQKLNRLLQREKERGGYYKGLPEHLDSLEELALLDFTTEEDLAQHGMKMVLTSQAEIQRVLSDATSGTTGRAKRVFYSEKDCENTIQLFMAGLGEFVFPGSRTMICMPFSGPFGLGELIAEAIVRLQAKPLKVGCQLSYGELGEILERERPDTYVGMPVQLLSMLRYCGKGSLKRALVSGDACPDSVVSECEKILGTRLFPHYGSREMGLGGAICCDAHEGMHLREHHVIAEIIDSNGNNLPPGEYGELVITTIGMDAMPLIRYRTGDYTRIISKKCPCGSEVIRLDKLQRNKRESAILGLDEALFALEGLIDYKAEIKEEGMSFVVLTDGKVSEAKVREKIEKQCSGRSVNIEIRKAQRSDRPLYVGKRMIRAFTHL